MGRCDDDTGISSWLFESLGKILRRCLFRVLSMGPVPNHFAFIMDGNRRYAKKQNMEEGAGHRDGFLSLMSVLKYCYELGVKYVTVYAFSIDNFRRDPDEVQNLMDLMLEKINGLLKEESIVNQYGIRVYFIGNLKLLSEPVRVAAEKVMAVTAKNSTVVLLVCVAYTSRDEIVHAVQESCRHKSDEIQAFNARKAFNGVIEEVEGNEKINGVIVDTAVEAEAKASKISNGVIMEGMEEKEKMEMELPIIKLVDIEKHMYMAVAPDPDIVMRSSGETRLSNFLLWQTNNCLLYSPAALWPEIGLQHLVLAVLKFQTNYSYLEKKKKQL